MTQHVVGEQWAGIARSVQTMSTIHSAGVAGAAKLLFFFYNSVHFLLGHRESRCTTDKHRKKTLRRLVYYFFLFLKLRQYALLRALSFRMCVRLSITFFTRPRCIHRTGGPKKHKPFAS